MSVQRTYWHLEEHRRKPSEYDIVTSKLLYHPQRGFEVNTPIGKWYREYSATSVLTCEDWDAFVDPRETTYAKYTAEQRRKEEFLDRIFESIETSEYDSKLPREWIHALERVLPILRYPVHGLQMAAAYLGQFAQSGRVVITCAFQAADELRRVHRLAERMSQLDRSYSGFGKNAKAEWQTANEWQPLRQLIERLLVTYDWSEAFVALNLVIKPWLDEMFVHAWAKIADRRGDRLLCEFLGSLGEDCEWHGSWTRALVRHLEQTDSNRLAIDGFVEKWDGPTRSAMEALLPLLEPRRDESQTLLLAMGRLVQERRRVGGAH